MISKNIFLVILAVVTLCGFTNCEITLENVYQEVLELRGAVRTLETKLKIQDSRISDLIKTVRRQRIVLNQAILGETGRGRSEKNSTNNLTSPDQINKSNIFPSRNVSNTVPAKSLARLEKRLLTGISSTAPLDVTVNIVAFYAYLSTVLAHTNLGPDHTIKFDVVKTNQGQGYHSGSGVFIAPQSGFYVFTWTVRVGAYNSSPEYHSSEIVINNSVYGSAYALAIPASSRDDSGTGTVVAHVNQGDDVYIKTHSSHKGNGGILSEGFGRSSFAGWKIN
ncbi:uncharacterized protein LOC133193161 [Saccostrea echinata]|uniref:uncharacterized protein LOC133193161 n=1 Tax=Saccostrea echinata TaxID=191078 RepID=UPI002A80D250|nr:uncharacterized protein LOC133193161 [Saccostrea echinata]